MEGRLPRAGEALREARPTPTVLIPEPPIPLLAACPVPLPAARPVPAALQAPAPLPPGLAAVWKEARAALAANDPAALAGVTRFPLRSNEFGGPVKDAAVLRQRWARIFPPAVRAALAKANLERTAGAKDTFETFTEAGGLPIRFLFTRTQAGWRLSALDNVNE